MIGLGEALAMTDEASLTGRAGRLFDAALAKAPNHPKALWYGSIAALQAGDLRKGRDRLQLLLAQNPPEQLRSVLERQIQDLNQQLNEAGQGRACCYGRLRGRGGHGTALDSGRRFDRAATSASSSKVGRCRSSFSRATRRPADRRWQCSVTALLTCRSRSSSANAMR